MQAFLTLPPELDSLPASLLKVSKHLYYHQGTSAFYKSSLLDPLTGFIGEDLAARQNIVLTRYDPSFLVLSLFAASAEVFFEDIPFYLSK